ncbi:hypothetical protein ACF3MZ_14240 [Paenibacillaceae bacterium WGS1546]|uniref:hypothetical protein n=1 Tax=Cohnella sp. WGS1546 TaxID=3366810 RepID=UPI00372D538A
MSVMINILKMDLYRFVTSKVAIILLLVFALFQLFGIFMMNQYEDPMANGGIVLSAMNESQFIQMILAQPPSWVMLYILVFAVYFYMSEYNAGFYKNYITMAKARAYSVISKLVMQAIFTLAMFLTMIAVDLMGRGIFFGNTSIGDPGYFAKLLIGQFLLHWAFSVLILCIAMMTRSILASVGIGAFLALNVIGMGLSALESLVSSLDVAKYWLVNVIVTIVDFHNTGIFMQVLSVALVSLLLFAMIAIRYKIKEDLK